MDPNCPGCPTNDEFANALATDVLSVKHSLYSTVSRFFGYEATFVQNEAGNYETGFVKTNDDFLTAASKYALDVLSVATFGRGGAATGGFLAKTPGKTALTNQAKNAINNIEDAFSIAKEGGRHSGFYTNALEQTDSQLRKGVNNLQKQIDEHKALINDPQGTMERLGKGDFSSLHPKQQKALVEKKWPSDISRQREQQSILKGILDER